MDLAAGGVTVRFAAFYLAIVWGLVALSTVEGFQVDLTLPQRLAIATAVSALNAVAMTVPWKRIAGTPRARVLLEAFPVAHVFVHAAAYQAWEPSPMFLLAMVAMVALGASHSRLPATLLVTGIPVLVMATGTRTTAVATGLMRLETAVLVGVVLLVSWVAHTAGRFHRASLRAAVESHADAMEHARQLEVVAGAARAIQGHEPDAVLQAVVDATADLGWDAAGIYVPAPSGVGHVLGAHRRLPPEVPEGPQPMIGLFGEVMRTGEPVSWEDYARHHDANPLWAGRALSAAGAPIRVHNVLRGAVVCSSERRRAISRGEVLALELLANQAGRALELADDFALQQQTVHELERVNRIKHAFLAEVGRDLRSPMAAVLGMAETLDTRWEAMGDGDRREMRRRLHDQAVDLERVVGALLDFSRLERGIVQPHRVDVAMRDVVASVLDRRRADLGDHDVAVESEPVGGDGRAWGDPALLERVVENLVENAVRHTPSGTNVRVFLRQDGANTIVEVADDGPGIAPEQLVAHLGSAGPDEAASRDQPGRHPTQGFGLGLAFCREVLALHDTELEVTTRRGVGTTVGFVLPRGRADER